MKAVMLSLRPQWCEKIFNGEKTMEVRKTCPKLEPPFEVLVYCTMPKERWSVGHQIFYNDTLYTLPTGELKIGDALELRADWMRKYNEDNFLNGKVIGSFVCDRVRLCIPFGLKGHLLSQEVYREMCLTKEQLDKYGGLKTLYGWHITEPTLFAKPRDITEFSRYGYQEIKSNGTGYFCGNTKCKYCNPAEVIAGLYIPSICKKNGCSLKRPPESWCYIEEEDNER